MGYKALALGARWPRNKHVTILDQQGRTMDAIRERRVDVVLDVGANRGFWSKHLRMLGYKGLILAFEPDPETFQHLERMAAGDSQWRVFNCALGSKAGEMDFHVILDGEQTVLSSAFKPLSGTPTIEKRVPVRTVAEVLQSENIGADRRIFLKMDTQGYDLEVFAGVETLDNIVMLQSEVSVVPIYHGMPHYTDALRRYEEAGFDLRDLFVAGLMSNGNVMEYDALMLKRD